MDTKPTIDTQGGSVVQGDVTVRKGDFVGRDKITNVFGLTRAQTLLLIAILSGVIVAIWLIVAPPAPPAPLRGDFTIGIAAIGEGDTAQKVVASAVGRALGDEFYRQLDDAIQQANLDFAIGLGSPQQIGAITGNTNERILRAREKATAMNVDLLLFGAITPGAATSEFVPELYINPDAFPSAEEAADYFALDPIEVANKFRNDPVSKNELSQQLVSRVEEYLYFSIGLGYLAHNNFAMAADYLNRAYTLAYQLQTRRDRAVLLLMLGIVANHQDDHATAYTYYNQALTLDPDYARALLGKGQSRFLMARGQCTNQEIDRAGVNAALDLYAEALTVPPLPYAEIPAKVALFRAHARTCLAEADAKAEDWQEAQLNYERVRRNYEANPSPLLRSLAAEAAGGLALVLLHEDVRDLAAAPVTTLSDALAAFEQAAELSRRPNRRAVFLLWQVALQIALGDCANAQASFALATEARQEFAQKNPTQPDSGLDTFYARVLADLRACTKGEAS